MAIETRPPHESDLETIDINVNVGPQHPATHGVFRMVLTVDGELVVDLDPVIGYMHRGNEKLPENCDYRQVIGYHDRTDYLAQFNTEHCYVEAVEKLAGIKPPDRAEYIRAKLAEINRIASHLMFFGAFGTDIGLFGTSFMYAFRDRETIQDLFEEVTGERMMYNYFRPGGVAWDLPDNFRQRCMQVLDSVERGVEQLDGLMMENEVVLARCRGLRRVLRVPAGEVYMRVESPRGEYGVYLVSQGSDKPWRHKVRGASFSNLSALRAMAVGNFVSDVIIILGSIDIVLCEVDR